MRAFLPILLLVVSNTFMTIAWYGHLKFTSKPLWIVIAASWGIAFFEYCFQVPANRLGYGIFTATQLKIIAEVLSLSIFIIFAYFYLGETIKWNYIVSFLFIMGAVYFAFAVN
ncbi:MAG TPA: DMT family protein [Candidatus Kapabacteria bacterium]|nr:DMT family protein [Candidatus Kapabacteria bacterium]